MSELSDHDLDYLADSLEVGAIVDIANNRDGSAWEVIGMHDHADDSVVWLRWWFGVGYRTTSINNVVVLLSKEQAEYGMVNDCRWDLLRAVRGE